MASSRRIILIYIIFAACWTLFSDYLVDKLAASTQELTTLQMVKGVLFVVISAALLYVLLERQFLMVVGATKRLRHYARRLELIRELEKALLSAESPRDISRTAVQRIREMTPCYRVSMTLMEGGLQIVRVSAVSAAADSTVHEDQRLPAIAKGCELLKQGKIFRVDDLHQLTELTPTEMTLKAEGIRSYFQIPIRVHGQLVGTVNLFDKIPHRFTDEDIAIASEFTDFLALAFQQAQTLETTRDENLRLESLRQAGLRLTESLKLNDVFRQVLDSALNLSERIDSVLIYIYQNDTLSLGRAFWRSHNGNSHTYPPRESGVHYAVARTGDAVVVEDIAQDARFRDETRGYSGSIVALPLKIGTEVIGVISVYSAEPRFITPDEISLMGMLSDQASLAVHNALLHEQMRLDMSQLDSLRQVSLYLTSQLELQPVLDVILEYTLALTAAQNAHIFLYDGAKLSFGAALWEGQRKDASFKEIREDGLTYRVARSGQRLVIPDMNNHELYQGTGYTGAIVGLPLLVLGKVRGVMNVSYNQPHRFTDQELNLMELISDHAAIAIHNAWLYEQLQHHAEVMEQEIAERTGELRTANTRLKELDRLRGKFVSDLSHELRTPVSSLTVRLYLLERAAPEQYPQHITVLKSQIALLNDFIQNAFDMSRLDLEMSQATLMPVAVNQVITTVIAAYREVAESKGIQLLYDLDDNLPTVQGAGNHLSQMVAHLISNAIHYTAAGHVKVSTSLDEPREHICIMVEDTGIGIDAEDQPYIFERFYRGKQVAQLIPGTGLGLSIVQAIVKLHNGWIKIDSKLGQGSTFSVWLPVDIFVVKNIPIDA